MKFKLEIAKMNIPYFCWEVWSEIRTFYSIPADTLCSFLHIWSLDQQVCHVMLSLEQMSSILATSVRRGR